MLWFTSDTHFFHENIIKYTNRPFHSVEDMNEYMIDLLNSVPSDDFVFHLGDLAMGKAENSLAWLDVRMSSVLDFRLVPGNHDRCHPMHTHKNDPVWRDWYLPFSPQETEKRIIVCGHEVLLCHFPYQDVERHAGKYDEFRPKYNPGQWLLHGHTHGEWRQKGYMIDVGIDAWGGQLVNQEQIAELIEAGPNDLPPLEWKWK